MTDTVQMTSLGLAPAVTDSDGDPFNPDSLPQALTYNSDGNVSTVTVTEDTDSWVKTFTWEADTVNGGFRLANVSAWVKA